MGLMVWWTLCLVAFQGWTWITYSQFHTLSAWSNMFSTRLGRCPSTRLGCMPSESWHMGLVLPFIVAVAASVSLESPIFAPSVISDSLLGLINFLNIRKFKLRVKLSKEGQLWKRYLGIFLYTSGSSRTPRLDPSSWYECNFFTSIVFSYSGHYHDVNVSQWWSFSGLVAWFSVLIILLNSNSVYSLGLCICKLTHPRISNVGTVM